MTEEKKQVEMTVEEAVQFEQFRAEQAAKDAKSKAKDARKTYNEMVDEEIDRAIPVLTAISSGIKSAKGTVLGNFEAILSMKSDVLRITKDNQKSHTFTNSAADKRITIGRYQTDGWRDTVSDGIAIVRESVVGLIRDEETKALVNQILRLIARDSEGSLKASKVLQLRKMAEELGNERLNEGIAIIEEAYIPTLSKTSIRAEYKDAKGMWQYIPLGMTEA
jgi:hypothetical protein